MRKLYLQKKFQIIYGLALVILVPLAVVFNTINLNRNYSHTIDIQLQRQALAFGRLFNNAWIENSKQEEDLDELIERTINSQQDIKAIQLLQFNESSFRVVASSQSGEKNQQISSPQYLLAWHQDQALATLVSTSQLDVLFNNTEELKESSSRFWLVVMPLVDKNGEKEQLLSMVISLEIMDVLIGASLTRSYIYLILTILFLILLLAFNIKLFEQAVKYRQIKEVNQMKDEFISIASHELRTPLTVIKGYVSMLLQEEKQKLDQETRGYLQTISTSTDRLADLVEDLLNVSRIEQGRLQMDLQEVDVQPIIKKAVDELTVKAQEKGLDLTANCPEKVFLNIDSKRLEQVLINIIGNAIKYTQAGSVKVEGFVKTEKLQIKISDTGIGMSPEDRSRLFEKFYRIKNTETKNITGTGLGLWISRQLVELMHGEIYIDSMEGVGTQVSIFFPLLKSKS